MIKNMDSLKRTVLELLLGIVISGIVFEILGLILAKEKLFFTTGLLFGMLLAAGMAIHMAYNINDALDWDANHAAKILKKGSMLRYAAVVLLSVLFSYLEWGNVIALWLGIMTLKTAAYMQPFVHKKINQILKIEEGGYENAITCDDDEFDFGEWAERGFHDPWSHRD